MQYLASHMEPETSPFRFSYEIAKIDSTSYYSMVSLRLSLDVNHRSVIKELENHGGGVETGAI